MWEINQIWSLSEGANQVNRDRENNQTRKRYYGRPVTFQNLRDYRIQQVNNGNAEQKPTLQEVSSFEAILIDKIEKDVPEDNNSYYRL